MIQTDYIFICPARKAMRGMASSTPGWWYTCLHEPSDDPVNGETGNCLDAVCHSAELPYVFYTDDGAFFNQQGESNLASLMWYYWFHQLAYNRSLAQPPPIGGSILPSPQWDPYNLSSNLNLGFDLPKTSIQQNYRSQFCDFWDQVGY